MGGWLTEEDARSKLEDKMAEAFNSFYSYLNRRSDIDPRTAA